MAVHADRVRSPSGSSTPTTITHYLQRYARWLNLPTRRGPALATHHARRAQDLRPLRGAARSYLPLCPWPSTSGIAIVAMTDSGYAGTDYALEREIDAEVLEQSVAGLGAHVERAATRRSRRPRDSREAPAVSRHAHEVRDQGAMRARWSKPVSSSASATTATASIARSTAPVAAMRQGPNPVYREPSTCARCLNFAVSTPHRPYWLDQVQRCEALLSEPALPTQTLKIVRERLEKPALCFVRSSHRGKIPCPQSAALSDHVRPPRNAHVRLTSALAILTETGLRQPERLTVSELCRVADVSRNSLYRYHAPDSHSPPLRATSQGRTHTKLRMCGRETPPENLGLALGCRQARRPGRSLFHRVPRATALLERRDASSPSCAAA